jgi:four helix bundle protein
MKSSFAEMPVWEKAHRLALDVYRLTASFPREEVYGLTSQIRRAALSVSGNIAEAYGRFHYLDKNRFYLNARGSLEETKNYVILSRDLGYLRVEDSQALMHDLETIAEELNTLVKTIRLRNTETKEREGNGRRRRTTSSHRPQSHDQPDSES